jgi:hypothetical protein
MAFSTLDKRLCVYEIDVLLLRLSALIAYNDVYVVINTTFETGELTYGK